MSYITFNAGDTLEITYQTGMLGTRRKLNYPGAACTACGDWWYGDDVMLLNLDDHECRQFCINCRDSQQHPAGNCLFRPTKYLPDVPKVVVITGGNALGSQG